MQDENVSIFDFNQQGKKGKFDYTPQSISNFVSYDVDLEDELEVFEGTIVKKQKTGFCRLVYKSGLYVEGIFRSGNMEGEGTLILPNGIEYMGIFRKGILEGIGTVGIEGT